MTAQSLGELPSGLWLALFAAWLVLSVWWRRRQHNPVFARPSPGHTFAERWASGRAGHGLLARLGTARNCLHVQVACGELRVHPHFPFTLGFMPELYGLDHVVPLGSIRSAVILGGNYAKAVEVRYSLSTGQEAVLQLLLRNAEGFIHAVLRKPAEA